MNIVINNTSMQPIYEQIVDQVKQLILTDRLAEHDPLPSVRSLANDLKIKGFKPAHLAKSPGKPQKWLGAEGWVLYARVQLYIQKHPNTSLREAIDNIRRKYYKNYTLNTLYSRYCEIQKTQIPDAINLFIKTSINSPLLTCTTEEVLSVITNLDT